jgi:hypothetical protein
MINSILKNDNDVHPCKSENPLNADDLVPESLKPKKTKNMFLDKKDGFKKMLFKKAQEMNAVTMRDMKARLQSDAHGKMNKELDQLV